MNALRHGLLSDAMILPSEDLELLEEIANSMYGELQPQGKLEQFFVDRIISCMWRLRRVVLAETFQIIRHYEDRREVTHLLKEFFARRWAENSLFNDSSVDKFLRYETTIERQLYRALNALIELRILRAKHREIRVTTNEPEIIK